MELDVETYRDAEALSQSRTLQNLEKTLEDLAYDMAECYSRCGCWEAEAVGGWLERHYGPIEWVRQDRQREREYFEKHSKEDAVEDKGLRRTC